MYVGGCVHRSSGACRGQRHPYPGAGVISSCAQAGRTANALNHWAIAPEACFLILEPGDFLDIYKKVTDTHVSLTVLYSYLKPDFPPFLCPWSLCLGHRLCQLPHSQGLTAAFSLRSWPRSSTNKETSVRPVCKINCPAPKPWTHTGRCTWLFSDNFRIVSPNGIKISRTFSARSRWIHESGYWAKILWSPMELLALGGSPEKQNWGHLFGMSLNLFSEG